MKIIFWIIFIVGLCSMVLDAENKGDISITYDYSSNQIKDDNHSRFYIWYGKNLTFSVVNINPFLYKVTINGQGMDYYKNEIPKNFSDLTKKVYENSVNPAKIEEAAVSTGEQGRNTSSATNLRGQARSAALDLTQLRISDVTWGSSFIFTAYQDFFNKLLQNKPCSEIEDDIVKSFIQIKKKYYQEDKQATSRVITTDDIPGELSIINTSIADRVNDINIQFGGKAELKKDIDKLKELIRLNSEMIAAINKANTKLAPINFIKSILFPTVDMDHFQVTVKVDPISSDVEVPFQVMDPINIKVKHGWKIDFSTGMQFILNADAQSFILEKDTDDATKVQIKKSYDRYSIKPTANVLMHVYVRSIRSLKWGGILFGLGTNDAKELTYFFGTGLMIGTKNRFIFNSGVALQKTKALKPQYTEGQILVANSEVTPESLLYEAIKPRFFFGISYNLSK